MLTSMFYLQKQISFWKVQFWSPGSFQIKKKTPEVKCLGFYSLETKKLFMYRVNVHLSTYVYKNKVGYVCRLMFVYITPRIVY